MSPIWLLLKSVERFPLVSVGFAQDCRTMSSLTAYPAVTVFMEFKEHFNHKSLTYPWEIRCAQQHGNPFLMPATHFGWSPGPSESNRISMTSLDPRFHPLYLHGKVHPVICTRTVFHSDWICLDFGPLLCHSVLVPNRLKVFVYCCLVSITMIFKNTVVWKKTYIFGEKY